VQATSTATVRFLGFTEHDARTRLIEAMALALTEKTYASISVADVVRCARVSKRTFYEHFAGKEECYLATYAALGEHLLARIAQAAAGELPAEQRLAAATYAYLGALEEMPALTRTFFTEIQCAGPQALEARRKVHQRFADVVHTLIEQGRSEIPNTRALSREMAGALVGATNELLLIRIEQGQLDRLHEVGDTILELIRSLLVVAEPSSSACMHPAR
jgi:AcrR family transcriptional regulator